MHQGDKMEKVESMMVDAKMLKSQRIAISRDDNCKTKCEGQTIREELRMS